MLDYSVFSSHNSFGACYFGLVAHYVSYLARLTTSKKVFFQFNIDEVAALFLQMTVVSHFFSAVVNHLQFGENHTRSNKHASIVMLQYDCYLFDIICEVCISSRCFFLIELSKSSQIYAGIIYLAI